MRHLQIWAIWSIADGKRRGLSCVSLANTALQQIDHVLAFGGGVDTWGLFDDCVNARPAFSELAIRADVN
jgi:hypothetical protein